MRSTFLVALLLLMSALFVSWQVGEGGVEAAGPTQVSSDITQDTNWTLNNSPYVIEGDILVDMNATLSIHPGVTVKFAGYYSIRVEGQIHAKGTGSQGITFTSGEANASSGDWNQIEIINRQNISTQIFENTTFMYGTNGLFFNLTMVKDTIDDTFDVKIKNCTFRDFESSGIYYAGRHGVNDSVMITGSAFNDTGQFGIRIAGEYSDNHGKPYIIANNVVSNNANGISWGGLGQGNNCSITGNILISNAVGIKLGGSSLYLVRDNELLNNSCGMSINVGAEGNGNRSIVENVIWNSTIGIRVYTGKAPLKFRYNDVVDSGQFNVVVEEKKNVSMINNWWGTTNTTKIDTLFYDYYDDINAILPGEIPVGIVEYIPYLSSAVKPDYVAPSSEPDVGDGIGVEEKDDVDEGAHIPTEDGDDVGEGEDILDGNDDVDDNDSEGDPVNTETPASPGEGSGDSGSQADEGISSGVWVAVLALVVLSLALVLVIHVNRKSRRSGSLEGGHDRGRSHNRGQKANGVSKPGRRRGAGSSAAGFDDSPYELEDLKDEVLEDLGGGKGKVSASVMRSRLRRMKGQGKIDGELYSSVMEDIERIEKEDGDL